MKIIKINKIIIIIWNKILIQTLIYIIIQTINIKNKRLLLYSLLFFILYLLFFNKNIINNFII